MRPPVKWLKRKIIRAWKAVKNPDGTRKYSYQGIALKIAQAKQEGRWPKKRFTERLY